MKSVQDTFKLSNGVGIPCIGFGTWRTPEGKETFDSVSEALAAGYRHVDTAAFYGNEPSVGKAVVESGIPRGEIFVTTKLWNSERGYDTTLRAFDESMKKSGLDYLDLYLIHWPCNKPDGAAVNAATWRAFEKLHSEGRIRSIGVSNFLVHHLRSLMEGARVAPMVNQIEFHPGQMQREVLDFCRTNGILVEAWAPLGAGRMIENPELKQFAARYGISVAQLCIKWCLQHGVLPLVKSVDPGRIRENAAVFDFTIDRAGMDAIDAMPYFGGSGLNPDTITF